MEKSILSVPCKELGCDKCCTTYTNPRSGPTLGEEEVPLFEGLVERNFLNRPRLKLCENGDAAACSQWVNGGCFLYGKPRPFICSTYPLILYKNELTLSLRCPWVSEVLLPKWAKDPMSEEEQKAFREARQSMRESVPPTLAKMWDEDLSRFEVLVKVLPDLE